MARLKALAGAAIAAIALGSGSLLAQEPAYRGPQTMMGRMGGPGGYGPGWGYRGGMGPMMGGRMGGGMMYGMMGYGYAGALAELDLNEAQRKQIASIQTEVRKKNWTVMGVMHDEMSKLRDAFWLGEKRDRSAILASNKRMFEIRQQMLENSLDAADRIEQVLTPQQRAQLKKQVGPGWMMMDFDE